MNLVVLSGRLTKDPEVRYSQGGEKPLCIATYTLAVDRPVRRDGEQTADFIWCKAFGKQGEFAEKYMHKGERFLVTGRLQVDTYTDREGARRTSTEVLVDRQEFGQAKGENASQGTLGASQGIPRREERQQRDEDGFVNVPDGFDGELPFN